MNHASAPAQINPDAIVEALFEVRLEGSEIPEVVLGRLLDSALWRDFARVRLPAADLPQPMRQADPALRFAPIVEMKRKDGLRIVRVGERVLSYHVLDQYPGWQKFREEIKLVLTEAAAKTPGGKFIRVGFRYINMLTAPKHFVAGILDTTLRVTLDGDNIASSLSLNYFRVEQQHNIIVKVATPEMVQGLKTEFSLLCDIDVATLPEVTLIGTDNAMAWIDRAHDLEKAEFFRLLPQHVIARLSSARK